MPQVHDSMSVCCVDKKSRTPVGKGINVMKSLSKSFVGAVLGLALHVPFAATAMDVDAEFEFASGLVELGFADLANRVVAEVVRLYPDQRDRATRIEGEILVAQRRFADAEELLQRMPEGHPQRYALQLQIARGHFRMGNTEEAQRLYEAFFDVYRDRVPTDPDLLRFYQDAAYQFGQMMERLGNRSAAAAAYQRLLNAGLDDPTAERRLRIDLARLYLRLGREASGEERNRYLDLVYELSERVQWGGYDLWFGQSIGLMANALLARDDEEGARQLLQRYMRDLNRIDRILREQNHPPALSPVASARFLLGELYEKQVHELRRRNAPESEVLPVIQAALTEFFTVFGQYGLSEWGPEASTRGRALVELLRTEYGRDVNIDFGEHGGQAAQAQFTMADDLFRQRNFERAIEEYLRILTSFPEGEPSLRALANLLLSYAHLEDDLHVKMMAEYLSERFAGQTVAANALLMASRIYVERRNEEMFSFLFDAYFAGFPQHERAPQLLFDMARRRENAGDIAAAMEYYERIVANYPRDRFALRARMAMANAAHEQGDFARAAELFAAYVAEATPGHERVRAQFMLADSQQRLGQFAQAIRSYGQVIQWLSGDNPPDSARPEDAERNARLGERALFFVGVCFSRITEPAAQVDDFRRRGISSFQQFLSRYPESSLAPTAMRHKGALQMALGQADAASQTFTDLANRYPDSEEGRSALFALVSSAFEIGQPEIARDAFRRMIESPDAYSPEEFTRVGQLMLDNGMYEDVIPAYERVVGATDDQRLLQLALFGLGSAYGQQGNYEQAVQNLSRLLREFPNTAFFFDAQFQLATANRELERFAEANTALADILRLSQDNNVIQKAQFELGKLQMARGDQRQALASFQRIALLQDPNNAALRSIIEESFLKSMELALELELFDEVAQNVAQYEETFPRGQHLAQVRRLRDEARSRAARR